MNTLRKLAGLVALSALVLVALMLSAHSASAEETPPPYDYITDYFFGFGTTVKPWVAVYDGSNSQPGLQLKRIAAGNGCTLLHDGPGYAELGMNYIVPSLDSHLGNLKQSSGATWMTMSIPVIGPSAVTVSYAALSTRNCQGCLPMTYVGAGKPSTRDFTLQTKALSGQWQQYTYQKAVFATGNTNVAIGFPRVNASAGFDCVSIKLEAVARP